MVSPVEFEIVFSYESDGGTFVSAGNRLVAP